MLKIRLLWLLSVLLLCVGPVFADGVDPVIQIDDPTCPPAGCTQVFSETPFPFSSNDTGGGTTVFQVSPNSAGFTTMDIETVGTFGDTTSNVQCFSNEFSCNVTFIDGVTDIFLTRFCDGDVCSGGFAPGDIFDIDLDNLVLNSDRRPIFDSNGVAETTDGVGGWGPDRVFSAVANLTSAPTTPRISAPEPSSALLLFAGVGALFARRKLLRS